MLKFVSGATKVLSLVAVMSCLWCLACRRTEDSQLRLDILITNARIFDGNGTTLHQGSIAIADGRITSVTDISVGTPALIQIDATGMTVMPGLIDTHRHLLLSLMLDESFASSPSTEALDRWVEREIPQALRQYLESGITTVLATADFFPTIVEIQRRVARGELLSPRLFVAGAAFTAPDGHPAVTICQADPWCRAHFAVETDDEDTARAKVREQVAAGVDVIKVVYDGSRGAKLDDAVFRAITDEAQRSQIPVVVHTLSVEDMIKAVDLGASRLVHTPVRGGIFGTEASRALIDAGVPIATTISPLAPVADDTEAVHTPWGEEYTPSTEALLEQGLSNVRQLWDDGVVVAFGTDLPRSPSEDLDFEVRTLSDVLSSKEILQALTRNAAEFMNLAADLGTLEKGKIADVLIVEGDPLADVSRLADVRVVIKDGVMVVDNR